MFSLALLFPVSLERREVGACFLELQPNGTAHAFLGPGKRGCWQQQATLAEGQNHKPLALQSQPSLTLSCLQTGNNIGANKWCTRNIVASLVKKNHL